MLEMLRARKCRLHIGCAILRGANRAKRGKKGKKSKKITHQDPPTSGHGNHITPHPLEPDGDPAPRPGLFTKQKRLPSCRKPFGPVDSRLPFFATRPEQSRHPGATPARRSRADIYADSLERCVRAPRSGDAGLLLVLKRPRSR